MRTEEDPGLLFFSSGWGVHIFCSFIARQSFSCVFSPLCSYQCCDTREQQVMTMMIKVLSIILAPLLLHGNVVLATRVKKVRTCPYNQVYLRAVQLGCPPTCDTPSPVCKAAPRPGCGCPEGQILAGSARRNPNVCIPIEKCQKCPRNQVFLRDVQYGCPPTCDQPLSLCRAARGPGCGCPEGTILARSPTKERPPKCIPDHECRCPRNQVFLEDVSYFYPASCEDPEPLCDGPSGRGCGCPKGMVLGGNPNSKNRKCVPPEECKCRTTGCNSEKCSLKPEFTTCVALAPTCEENCLQQFGKCETEQVQCVRPPCLPFCNWNTDNRRYENCMNQCKPDKPKCQVSGCNSEVCSPETVFTICAISEPATCEERCFREFRTCETEEVVCKTESCDPICSWKTDNMGYNECMDKCDDRCKVGLPVKEPISGKELFCGRGPNRDECPYGTSCVIHPTDRYAVCCNDCSVNRCAFISCLEGYACDPSANDCQGGCFPV